MLCANLVGFCWLGHMLLCVSECVSKCLPEINSEILLVCLYACQHLIWLSATKSTV